MNNKEKPSYDIIIPANVRHDNTLKAHERLLYGEIISLSNKNGECFINNEYFAELYGVTNHCVIGWINKLKNKGYINIEAGMKSDKEVFDFLNKKNSSEGCLFCGYNGVAIDEHHYPIRKKDGGKETIRLCANCHREFHFLADYKRKITVTNKKDVLIKNNLYE